ncbi:FtsX-like permease family protein [Cryobacterium algoricola]|uniref:FtsX-like permease family protein n=1 Tax=Cryobacterium algoricola TaxID=1259183 RepID=A0ABY2IBQ8_9MICO|nr:FtsX-like permease family protein [Cryobacterium algoricola]TFB84126.1 FtsX-like permease family protein [Cryobacterium algoricola]
MSVAVSLAPRLAIERIRATKGAGVLDAMAVLAFTVSSWLALTVAGGTWMFFQRWQAEGALPDSQQTGLAITYVALACFACALLVIPILGLGGGAARLGARGRVRRLASLRLIGMTSGEVVRMSVIETLVQAVAGAVLGSAVFVVSLPLWQLLSFQMLPIGFGELLLPWWLWLAVIGALLLLAVASTVLGLRRVTISPLGIARDHTPRRLKTWRLVVVVALVVAFLVYAQFTNIASFIGLVTTVVFLALVIGSINLVGPWLMQLVARPGARTSNVARLLAARRILDDPRGAWRNVASLAFLGFIAGFVVTMPATGEGGTDTFFVHDIQTGVAITLAVGLILAATATLMTQASQVFDRAAESIALDRMGVPATVHLSVRRRLVVVPLAVALGTSVPLGLLLSTVAAVQLDSFPVVGVSLLAGTVILGFLLSLGAAEACRPLQAGILTEQRRRND